MDYILQFGVCLCELKICFAWMLLINNELILSDIVIAILMAAGTGV